MVLRGVCGPGRLVLLRLLPGAVDGELGNLLLSTDERVSAATRKGDRGGGGSAIANLMVKGQGKRRRASPGCFSTEGRVGAKVHQHDPREEDSLGRPECFTRSQIGAIPHPGGDGAKGSTGGSRFARNAPPWWSGTGPHATTWHPTARSSARMMGVLKVSVGDPLKCMTSLIREQKEKKEIQCMNSRADAPGGVGATKRIELKREEDDRMSESRKGSFGAIMDILQGKDKLRQAREVLRGDFLAKSSRAAQKTKREQVLAMARASIGQGRQIFPLQLGTIEDVAAAIKAGGWTSGDQYLNELKLMHVEAGFEVTPQMGKLLTDCKRSIRRNRGPVKRAPEVNLNDIEQLKWMLCCKDPRRTLRPALAYAWAVIWMLREIEVGAMRWKDVKVNEQNKRITIFIPLSKCDQQGLGVRRTLQCCMSRSCPRWCCWKVWAEIYKAYRGAERDPSEFIFQDTAGRKLSKAKMVEGWAMVTNDEIQGHSARRSGAMNYVRLGMPIQELAFLGRWKSSVVLSYAEDALQSEPANKSISNGRTPKPKKEAQSSDKAHDEDLVTDLPKELNDKSPGQELLVSELPKKLWVASTAYSSRERVWHQVEGASWNVPIETWTSICGWPFSRNSSKVVLQSQLTLCQRKCKKCLRKACGDAREVEVAS